MTYNCSWSGYHWTRTSYHSQSWPQASYRIHAAQWSSMDLTSKLSILKSIDGASVFIRPKANAQRCPKVKRTSHQGGCHWPWLYRKLVQICWEHECRWLIRSHSSSGLFIILEQGLSSSSDLILGMWYSMYTNAEIRPSWTFSIIRW